MQQRKPTSKNVEPAKEEQQALSPDAKAVVSVTTDCMSARILLSAPLEGGATLSEKSLLQSLAEKGVVMGIKTDFITRLVKHPVYDRSFVIAQGQLPENGKDEELLCHFENNDVLAPRQLEDGSTDYKNLGFGHSVAEGDVVAEILPVVPGIDGFNVIGRVIEGKQGKALHAPTGTNVALAEDGRSIIATASGNASMKDKKIHVRKEMAVTHVDQSTGNIVFAGDVQVKGDVRDGFTVRAGGSINIGGVVENATLVAGRDIIIKTGVHGEASSITAGGGIRTGYIEMGTFRAQECIYADVVLNADLESEDKVILTGKRACLIGGRCRVAKYFEAKVVGNDANTATSVELIQPGSLNPERDELTAKIRECGDRIAVVSDAIKSTNASAIPQAEKKTTVSQLMSSRREAENELRAMNMELSKLPSASERDSDCLMVVHEHIYPNVTINFDNTVLRNTFMRPACRVNRKKDKIIFSTHS